MSARKQIKQDVERWGEVHATIDEREQELEIRLGQADFQENVLVVETKTDYVKVPYGSIKDWYVPQQIWHQ